MASKGDLEVEDKSLQNLKSKISRKWKDVGRRLGLKEEQLDNLEKDRSFEGHEDVCYGMLCTWKMDNGPNATYNVLANALRQAGRTDLADGLLKGKFDADTAADNISEVSRSPSTQPSPEVAGTGDYVPQKTAAPPAVPLPQYKMENDPTGKCVILTYDKFWDAKNLDTKLSRDGNNVDAENLENTFTKLGFDVDNKLNLNMEDTMKILKTMAQKRFGSFVLFVCSHGNEESFFTSDKQQIQLQAVLTLFNADESKGFLNKPKMFFFNSCRGGEREEMAKADDASSLPENVGVVSNITYYRPTQADFFVVLSTVPGFISWRYLDPKKGSYFVRNLTTTLEEYHNKHHLYDIVTKSNDNLLQEFEKIRIETGRSDSICQVPTIISTLTKAVYFKDK